MNPDELKELLDRYLSGRLSAAEKAGLLKAIDKNKAEIEAELLQSFRDDSFLLPEPSDEDSRIKIILSRISNEQPVPLIRRIPWLRLVAASLIFFIAGLFYFNYSSESIVKKESEQAVILPAKSGAVLILADGTSLVLDSTIQTRKLQQGGSDLVVGTEGLTYNQSGIESAISYNTLQVPRGKQYFVKLADGSRVWLNAASTLRYPTTFTEKNRTVEISGEAYFEIAHDAAKPFIVKKGQTEITVLGTHFNVNAYDDQDSEEITLLEGSVHVTTARKSVTLSPGEQARITDELKIVTNVDTDEVIAWKEGKFQFGETADIHAVMHQIANWYDVEVIYHGNITKHIGGTISRQVDLAQLLKILQATGTVNFKVEGRTVEVSPQ